MFLNWCVLSSNSWPSHQPASERTSKTKYEPQRHCVNVSLPYGGHRKGRDLGSLLPSPHLHQPCLALYTLGQPAQAASVGLPPPKPPSMAANWWGEFQLSSQVVELAKVLTRLQELSRVWVLQVSSHMGVYECHTYACGKVDKHQDIISLSSSTSVARPVQCLCESGILRYLSSQIRAPPKMSLGGEIRSKQIW